MTRVRRGRAGEEEGEEEEGQDRRGQRAGTEQQGKYRLDLD